MYYYKVFCSYGEQNKVIYYSASKNIIAEKLMPIGLKAIVDIWTIDKIEEISKEEFVKHQVEDYFDERWLQWEV